MNTDIQYMREAERYKCGMTHHRLRTDTRHLLLAIIQGIDLLLTLSASFDEFTMLLLDTTTVEIERNIHVFHDGTVVSGGAGGRSCLDIGAVSSSQRRGILCTG